MLKVNALGQPSPNRTDFTAWERSALEKFARQAADENLLLRDRIDKLEFSFDRAFFEWCADRFVYAKGDDPSDTHVLRLRKMAGTRS